MDVALLHHAVPEDAPADERDVLVQVEAVGTSLRRLGHEPFALPITLDLGALSRQLCERRPAVVFNLVESLGGTDRLAPAVPILLESLGIPYTGNNADALYVTNSKRLTKQRLSEYAIPTPAAVYVVGERAIVEGGHSATAFPGRFLLKALYEHASFAMDDAAVIEARDVDDVVEALGERCRRFNKPFFAERYIDGREFNLSLLGNGEQTTLLPPAEITFDAFPAGKPRIVGYAAKWAAESFEFRETPRRFDFPAEDESLLDELNSLAERTWLALDLCGYARVDFRVDATGQPWVIEANANPCLSPDAGFAAALQRAGISFDEAVRRLIASACGPPAPRPRPAA
jgi:D-alanine-D-alanine ligase